MSLLWVRKHNKPEVKRKVAKQTLPGTSLSSWWCLKGEWMNVRFSLWGSKLQFFQKRRVDDRLRPRMAFQHWIWGHGMVRLPCVGETRYLVGCVSVWPTFVGKTFSRHDQWMEVEQLKCLTLVKRKDGSSFTYEFHKNVKHHDQHHGMQYTMDWNACLFKSSAQTGKSNIVSVAYIGPGKKNCQGLLDTSQALIVIVVNNSKKCNNLKACF